MKLLIFSDFDSAGGGYATITASLGTEMSKRGHDVTVLGLDYKGDEHPCPFPVIPTDTKIGPAQMGLVLRDWKPDAFAVIMDLSWQEKVICLSTPQWPPYVGIFAVEGAPLLDPSPWAAAIKAMDLRYAISDFGRRTVEAAGIKCKHIPIGVDEFWQPKDEIDRKLAKISMGLTDRFVIITVCDNQERKNIPCAIEAVAKFKENHEVCYVIVSKARPTGIGYDIWAEVKKNKLEKDTMLLSGGVSREKLRDLYAVSDAFLLTSKAEGLGLPPLEAMACGCPPVCTNTCGLPDMLEGRGLLINSEYEYTDPFGNTRRHFASADHAAELLGKLCDKNLWNELRQNGLDYTATLKWERAAEMLEEDLRVAQEKA